MKVDKRLDEKQEEKYYYMPVIYEHEIISWYEPTLYSSSGAALDVAKRRYNSNPLYGRPVGPGISTATLELVVDKD